MGNGYGSVQQTGDNTYNGWTNWETWLVSLWIDNEQTIYEHYLIAAREELSKDVTHREAEHELSVVLSEQFDEMMPDIGGLYLDLLSGALREVNWREISRHLAEQVDEEDTYIEQAN